MGKLLIRALRLYRILFSSISAGSCRFHPSCSQYAIDAISKYGPVKGILSALKRVGRCHPFHPGGYDPA